MGEMRQNVVRIRTLLVNSILVLTLFTVYLSVQSQSIGKCSFLDPQLALKTTCFGVVDYEYFLPNSLSVSDLNRKAADQLADARLQILPVKCQESLKKAICSNIYYKCTKNYNESNLTTYDHRIFEDIGVKYPIPFQRPCVDVCDNANKDCLGVLKALGIKMDCFERFDYSYMGYGTSIGNASYSYPFSFTYDQSNDAMYCNNIPAISPVGSSIEPYIFARTGGVCAGILTTLYVPPGPEVSSALAPMQKPYVVQSAIEEKLLSGNITLSVYEYMDVIVISS
jgi:hypothetical protein